MSHPLKSLLALCCTLSGTMPLLAIDADPAVARLADLKPLALQAYGLRRAGATSPTTVQVVIGPSITGAAGKAEAYRIIGEGDPAYAYRDFVRPVKAAILNERKNAEFTVPEGFAAPKAADIRSLTRTVVELTLPAPLKEGRTYHVVAIGVGSEMVTAGKTAASFAYRAAEPYRDDPAGDVLGATMTGLRRITSVGNGVLLLEFGAGYSVPGGNKLAHYAITVNGKPVSIHAMGRRSKIDVYLPVGWPFKGLLQHEVFLDIGAPLKNGDVVRVEAAPAVTCGATAATLVFDDRESFSSAIKVNQVGYVPDGLKLARVGRWLGSFPDPAAKPAAGAAGAAASAAANLSASALFAKGPAVDAEADAAASDGHTAFYRSLAPWALRFDAPPAFEIRRADTHEVVFTGAATLNAKGDAADGRVNHSAENVFDLDFTAFKTPGRYYIAIAGVGRSFAFGIGEDVYQTAFETQAYGVFAQRCGQELAPPYSDWERIACHVAGVVPTTEKRYLAHEFGKFVENRVMRPNPQGASDALRAAQNAPSLIAYFPFEGDAANRVPGGMALAPVGKAAYVRDGAVTGGKDDQVYATGEADNGFTGELAFDRAKGLTLSFWMRRDDAFGGNRYEGTVVGLFAHSPAATQRPRVGIVAGWGVLRHLNAESYGRVGDNRWRHYALQFGPPDEKQTGKTSLYVDGKLQSQGEFRYGDDNRFFFGNVSSDAARGCYFDELRIYNETLAPAAIRALGERVAHEVPVVLEASGGHHDAGDYNPRSHIDVAQTLLTAYELFPKKFFDGQLNIPEKANGIPDIVDEALWALRLWHGLYDAETGAVHNGTESQGDPNFIQTVELDDRGDYAWAPDAQGSLHYAGTLAQAARILAAVGKPNQAAEFVARAEKAYAWGKAHKPDVTDLKVFGRFYVAPLAFAAAQLHRTTGKAGYHEDFLANTPWKDNAKAEMIDSQGNYDLSLAAYAYALTPDDRADATVKQAVLASIRREAEMYIGGSSKMAYKFIRHPYAPITWGTGAYHGFCMPVLHLASLSETQADRDRYREWLIRSADNTLGNNPMNLSWIVGLGAQTIRAPLHNSRYSKFGMPVRGMQSEGPNQRGEGYHYIETAYPKHDDRFAVMHTFIDSSFAIAMDEGVVHLQAKSMALFGALLPDRQ